MGQRSWWYQAFDDECAFSDEREAKSTERARIWWTSASDGSLDFESLYQVCEGTIIYRQDCGRSACGSVNCCHSTGPDNFIFFLPNELDYQVSLSPGIPFVQVDSSDSSKLHCDGNEKCIYEKRPLDCRSYPYFPAVCEGRLVGYYDCRAAHDCPLQPEKELKDHLKRIHVWWSRLLLDDALRVWAEETAESSMQYRCPIVELPSDA